MHTGIIPHGGGAAARSGCMPTTQRGAAVHAGDVCRVSRRTPLAPQGLAPRRMQRMLACSPCKEAHARKPMQESPCKHAAHACMQLTRRGRASGALPPPWRADRMPNDRGRASPSTRMQSRAASRRRRPPRASSRGDAPRLGVGVVPSSRGRPSTCH